MADDDDVVDDPQQQHQLWASQANVEDIDFTAPGAQARISSWHTYLSGPLLIKNVLKGDQFKHIHDKAEEREASERHRKEGDEWRGGHSSSLGPLKCTT